MRIWWIKCPNCKKLLESGSGGSPGLGEMFLVCPQCQIIVRTNDRKEWDLMRGFEKAWFLFRVAYTTLLIGGGSGVFAGLISAEALDFTTPGAVFVGTILGVGLAWWLIVMDVVRAIRESRKRMNDPDYRKIVKMLGVD